jgi:O-antigen/teichoic acid export membrane protein
MTVIKNSYWNILAIVVSSIVAIPALGLLARILGVELFGVFTLMFSFIGYASVFDMGISRALVRCISINRNSASDIKEYLFIASAFVFVISLFIGVLIYLFRLEIVGIFNVTDAVRIDVTNSLFYVSFSVPFLLLNIVWQSYLEGLERFKELSLLKVLANILLSVIPFVFVFYYRTIDMAVAGLVLARILSFFIFFGYAYRSLFNEAEYKVLNFDKLNELFKFGGWLTVSNLISPLMVYFDRFVLTSTVGATSVALYTAPAEILSKMQMIPSAISKAIFPKLSSNMDREVVKYSFILMGIVALGLAIPLFIFSSWVLEVWLGQGYEGASLTLRILLVGFIFNALAQIPYTCIQARGYSNITARVHLAEVFPYFVILYFLVSSYSYLGAAVAWTARVIIDCLIFVVLWKRMK